MAALPWILMPSNSTHSQIARALFQEHGIEPGKLIETDQESVIANLVVSGIGISLLPERLALELQKAGEICIMEGLVMRASLWFIYLAERANDPLIHGVIEVLREIWAPTEAGQGDTSRLPQELADAGERSRSSAG